MNGHAIGCLLNWTSTDTHEGTNHTDYITNHVYTYTTSMNTVMYQIILI